MVSRFILLHPCQKSNPLGNVSQPQGWQRIQPHHRRLPIPRVRMPRPAPRGRMDKLGHRRYESNLFTPRRQPGSNLCGGGSVGSMQRRPVTTRQRRRPARQACAGFLDFVESGMDFGVVLCGFGSAEGREVVWDDDG